MSLPAESHLSWLPPGAEEEDPAASLEADADVLRGERSPCASAGGSALSGSSGEPSSIAGEGKPPRRRRRRRKGRRALASGWRRHSSAARPTDSGAAAPRHTASAPVQERYAALEYLVKQFEASAPNLTEAEQAACIGQLEALQRDLASSEARTCRPRRAKTNAPKAAAVRSRDTAKGSGKNDPWAEVRRSSADLERVIRGVCSHAAAGQWPVLSSSRWRPRPASAPCTPSAQIPVRVRFHIIRNARI